MDTVRDRLRALITKRLEKKKPPASAEVIEALTSLAVGYLASIAGPIRLLPLDPSKSAELREKLLAHRFADLFRAGQKPNPPIKGVYRRQMRMGVDAALNGRDTAWPTEDTRIALTNVALGFWDDTDYRAVRSALPYLIVGFYVAGESDDSP